jgi:hypothetical protein
MQSSRENHRTVKPQVPLSVWLTAFGIGASVLLFILFATWQTGINVVDAKMTGTVISKEYRPLEATETQITLNRDGAVRTDRVDGDYIITVEVPLRDGPPKTYTVWLNSRERFDAVAVGDKFDVGPYVVETGD